METEKRLYFYKMEYNFKKIERPYINKIVLIHIKKII